MVESERRPEPPTGNYEPREQRDSSNALRWLDKAPRLLAVLSGPAHVFEFANDAFRRSVGDRPLIGLAIKEAFPELQGQGFFEVLDGVLTTGEAYVERQAPVMLRKNDAPEHRVFDFSCQPILDGEGRPEGLFVDASDLTPDRPPQRGAEQIERRRTLLGELNDRIRDLDDPADISFAAAEVLGSTFGVSRAGYGTIDPVRETITIDRDWNAPGIETIAGVLNFRDYGAYIDDLKRGETVVCDDAYADPRTAMKADALKAISAQAFVNMPVREQGGVVALLYLNHAHARMWTSDELALIREVAERTRVAVERRRAEIALEESARRLRLAAEAARMAVWEYDVGANSLKPSPELNQMLGYDPEAVLNLDDVRARYHDDDRETLRLAAEGALARGERFFEAQHRFRRGDDDWRWFLLRGEILFDEDGAPSGVVGVLLDVTDQRTAEQSLRQREADLKAALDAGAMAPFEFDHVAGVMAPSDRLNELYAYPPGHVITLGDLRARYHPDDQAAFLEEARRHQAEPDLKPFAWELRLLLPGGETRWIEGRGEYDRAPSGQILRSRGVIMDITQRKRAQEHQRLLVNELNHRVKNTLAIVQGLAHQSFRRHGDPEPARAAFESRLSALAAAHNLLTRNSWESAFMGELVEACLSAALGEAIDRVGRTGPDLRAPPQTAVSIALALHELATNAVKYGALSKPDGRVDIEWRVYRSTDGVRFGLAWTETGGPPVVAPRSRGFGSRMIEQGLAAELGGEATLNFAPEGLSYTVDAPLPSEGDSL